MVVPIHIMLAAFVNRFPEEPGNSISIYIGRGERAARPLL
jgi:hypothetical protein